MDVFNKTIIPLALVGYEMIVANSYPTRTRGIIINYYYTLYIVQQKLERKNTKDMDYNNSSWRFRPWGSRVVALSIKCDSLPLRTESREEWIFSSGTNSFSVWEWSEWEIKCPETTLGLDLMLVLSTAHLCSLNLYWRTVIIIIIVMLHSGGQRDTGYE